MLEALLAAGNAAHGANRNSGEEDMVDMSALHASVLHQSGAAKQAPADGRPKTSVRLRATVIDFCGPNAGMYCGPATDGRRKFSPSQMCAWLQASGVETKRRLKTGQPGLTCGFVATRIVAEFSSHGDPNADFDVAKDVDSVQEGFQFVHNDTWKHPDPDPREEIGNVNMIKLVRHWAEPGFVSQSGNLEHHIIPADYFQARVGRLLDGQDAFGPASSWFIVATAPSSERGYPWYTVLLEVVSGEARKTRAKRRSELDGLNDALTEGYMPPRKWADNLNNCCCSTSTFACCSKACLLLLAVLQAAR